MAKTKRKIGKAKTSSRKSASQKASGRASSTSAQLRKLIEDLIDARQRGDYEDSRKASAALDAFHRRAAPAMRQTAAEAKAVAEHPVMVDSLRLLGDIAARLRTPSA